MTPFFSFIVPCCDVEPYVEECIQSVLDQPFQDWECLIGIESSTDRTEEIIRKKTSGDPRFKIFTGPRTGSCSASRNTGLDMARGEYVIFLDGDDTIAAGCLSRLHDKICACPGADLYPCVIVTCDEIGGGTNEFRDNYRPDAPAEMSGVEATLYLDRNWRGALCPMLQLTVFRRLFLVENELKCIRGLRYQDSEFSPRALYLAKRIIPLHEPFYLYRIRANSVQTKAKGADYFIKDFSIITRSLLSFYGHVSKMPDFDGRVTPCWIRQWLSRMNLRWFHSRSLREISRDKRVETLCYIFEDGFDAYRDMLKSGSVPQRIAGFFVRMFVLHPSMRWASELFFRFYFLLTEVIMAQDASIRKGYRHEFVQNKLNGG